MKRALMIMAVCSVASSSLADADLKLQSVNGVRHAKYSFATGRLTPDQASKRHSDSIWDMTLQSGRYWGSMASDTLPIDWGDVTDGSLVDGFAFQYGTDLSMPTTIDFTMIFYSDYSGYNNEGFYATYAFYLSGLPTAVGEYNTWTITADLGADPNDPGSVDYSFRITGNDLDDNDMADFGYGFWFPSLVGQGSRTGPTIADFDRTLYPLDPNGYTPYAPFTAVWEAFGAEYVFDRFHPDAGDPNDLVYYGIASPFPEEPNDPFLQCYLNLFGAKPCGGGGASGNYCYADIDGSGDCAVGLSDLSKLLSNYGASGTTHHDGDVEGHDGDVDLADLAALLAQYGDDCGL